MTAEIQQQAKLPLCVIFLMHFYLRMCVYRISVLILALIVATVVDEIQMALNKLLIISTLVVTIGVAIPSFIGLPTSLTNFLILDFRRSYTIGNFSCAPVQDVADSCKTGATTNVIIGLALGYKLSPFLFSP
ncbi:vacuolar H+-pyrophosphatase [Tanacetum coccineum]